MVRDQLRNANIISRTLLPTPREVLAALPVPEPTEQIVLEGRATLTRILEGVDPRIFFVVGPCSIHDVDSAREYASRLRDVAGRVEDAFVLVMRVYFEKPRTTIGWKGFINDPHLDDSFRIDEGLLKARELLLEFGDMGLMVGTEALDPITPQYLSDLVSWTAIGARTTESQTHREMASGLSTPVGIKNGTDGSGDVAINALQAVAHAQHFLGITVEGQCAVYHTRGNRHAHVVLRGGREPNYDSDSVASCENKLKEKGLPTNIMIDCSHGNSSRDPARQPEVLRSGVDQILAGNRSIVGFMLESNLCWGRQDYAGNPSRLEYGVSITDACVDWKTTEELLWDVYQQLKPVLPKRRGLEHKS